MTQLSPLVIRVYCRSNVQAMGAQDKVYIATQLRKSLEEGTATCSKMCSKPNLIMQMYP